MPYFTFGQVHRHIYKKQIFDKNVVVYIAGKNARKKMFEIFGSVWAFEYDKKPDMKFFPRGIIKIENKKEKI